MEEDTSWYKDIKEFADSTTAHGINLIFEAKSRFVRILLILMWISCATYTVYVMIISIKTFVDKPTGTEYAVREIMNDSNPQSIQFPTISICSHNKIKRSYLYREDNKAVKEYWQTLNEEFAIYNEEKYTNFIGQIDWTIPNMSQIANLTYQEVISAGGPDDNRLLDCLRGTKQTNCKYLISKIIEDSSDMNKNANEAEKAYLEREDTRKGKCWRVNPKGLISGKSGDHGKMRLFMWADLKDYTSSFKKKPEHGFSVVFHDNNTYGSTLNSGYYLSPGSIYKVDLRKKIVVRVPHSHGCNASLVETTYGSYHEGSCVMECKDRFLNQACGCIDIAPPVNTPGYKSCTLQQWADCGHLAFLNFSSRYEDPNLKENMCPCPSPCNAITYAAQLSSSTLSRAYVEYLFSIPYTKDFLSRVSQPDYNITYDSSKDIHDNVMILEVLFSSMATSETRQILIYTTANLLGDIGGVLGIFLGASVFTVIEFAQLIMRGIRKCWINRWCCRRDKDSQKESEQGQELE